MDLDKPRFWVDFNDRLADDLVVLSEFDIMTDSSRIEWYLDENAAISVYSRETLADKAGLVTLIADGVIIRNTTNQRPEVQFCCKIDARGVRVLVDLDKLRLPVDFNELLADDLILLAREDEKPDSACNLVHLHARLPVGIYSDDNLDSDGRVNPIIADGVAVLNDTGLFPHVKWCCKIDAQGIRYLTDERKLSQLISLMQNLTPGTYTAKLADARAILRSLQDNDWTAEGLNGRQLSVHALKRLQRKFMAQILDDISRWRKRG